MGHMSTSPRVRMTPESRREQLLDLGIELLATRSLEDLSIEVLAEEAGISRGLLYHYFGSKQEFHLAVVRRAADDLIAITAPRDVLDPLEQLAASVAAYVDYVEQKHGVYTSLVRAAAGGNEALREVYESARQTLVDRIFDISGPERLAEMGVRDSPAVRMMAHGWATAVEDITLAWIDDHRGLERADLLKALAGALPGMVLPVLS
ncbi:MAG: transcriptional regulator, TetR family [Marmoricola sp.]|nr:transcriptional regulator, TetR family [Marmoricola sp.]